MVLRSLFLVLALVLSACGKPFSPANLTSSGKDFTGAKNANGTPYTGASESSDLEVLKQQIDPSSKENLDFAASVKSAVIVRQDLAGNTVTVAPAKLNLKINLGGKVSEYSPVLNSSHDASSVSASVSASGSSANSDVRLNVHCLDANCAAVEVRLSRGTVEAGFIYRLRSVSVETLGPFSSGGATTNLDHIATEIAAEKSPLLTTVEVAWGPAIFDLHVADIEASGDLIATGGEEENVAVVVKNQPTIKGRLVGNSNHGDLLLRVNDGEAWAFLRIRLPLTPGTIDPSTPDDSGTTDTTPVTPDVTPATDRYIPYDTSNAITARWQREKSNPVVQAEIANMSTGKRSGDMKKFLARLRPSLGAVLTDLKTQDLPPEFAFIMFVESSYFYSEPQFRVSVSGAGAVGPWQFMPGTGSGLGLRTFDITSSKDSKGKPHYAANACDQRGDLHKSTLAAAKYLRELLTTFRHDPKLAVMAYNMGAGGMKRRMSCAVAKQNGAGSCAGSIKPLQEYDAARLDYWEIRRLNAAPQESIDYVPRFLAAQFVGRAPSASGVSFDTSFSTPAPELPASCAH